MNTITPSPCRRLLPAAALVALLLLPGTAYGLDPLEELLDRSEQEGNGEALVELLQELRNRPVEINTATEQELLRIPVFSAVDVSRVVAWRDRNGMIGSVAELEAVVGAAHARQAAPYLSFGLPKAGKARGPANDFKGSVYTRAWWETPPRKGIQTGKYQGGNLGLSSRVEASGRNWGIGFVQQKDIGEPDTADFLSFSVHAERLGIVSRAVAGNYRLSFGQGLLFGQGRYFSKGTDPVDGVVAFASSVRPYISASEDNFMQGAAVTLAPGPLEITAFASRNRLDATVKEGVATSVTVDGYHRTTSERDRKDSLSLEAQGVNLRYRYQAGGLRGGIGGTLVNYRYGMPVEWLGGDGRERRAGSVEASAVYHEVQAFGEAAYSEQPAACSWIVGLQGAISPGVTGVASARRYDTGYFSPFSGAFAERGSDGANEEGFYLGLNAKVLRNLDVGVSYDLFRFPELSGSYRLPYSGHDARLNFAWRQNPAMTWSGLYQHKQTSETKTQTEGGGWLEYVMPVPKTTNRVQLGVEAKASSSLTVRTRGEYRSVESIFASGRATDRGWLLYGQLRSSFGRLSVTARYTRFATDSYDAAVYAYEDDLPLVYSLGTYSGRGQAMFLLMNWEATPHLRLVGKFEKSWYSDRSTSGSGNDLRDTSSPGSFNVGAMLKF
ncbi:MAG: helix-hairpin-helix domain-containing protein [Chlorobiaceae bacterium]|nr:helix-hairpin-helix domain-containing protein [Chlorobiaceae bacterium]